MRTSRFLPRAAVWPWCSRPALAAVLRKSALATQDRLPAHYKAFTAALAAIESQLRRAGASRTGWSTAPSTACCRRSTRIRASWTRAPTRRCASGRRQRYYGLGITIQVDRPQHHRRARVRRLAGLPEGPAPRRRHRQASTGQDTKGWTTEQAVTQAARAEGHVRQHLDASAPAYDELLAHGRDARRGHHPEHPGALHDSTATIGYIRLEDFAEHTDDELGEALEDLRGQGMKRLVLDLRGNPGGAARSGHPRLEPLPAARRPDRLHARPRRQLRRGLPRHATERLPRRADGGAGQPQQRQRVGDRLGRAAGSRPRARRRRDNVRQGARAVGLPRQPGRRRWR